MTTVVFIQKDFTIKAIYTSSDNDDCLKYCKSFFNIDLPSDQNPLYDEYNTNNLKVTTFCVSITRDKAAAIGISDLSIWPTIFIHIVTSNSGNLLEMEKAIRDRR